MNNKTSFLIISKDDYLLNNIESMAARAFPYAIIHKLKDGDESWAYLKKNFTSIIISDLELNGLDGITLCKRIKADNETKDGYFILLTQQNDNELKARSLEEGADDFLSKPIIKEELVTKLRAAYRIVRMKSILQKEGERLRILTDRLDLYFEEIKKIATGLIQARMPDLANRIPLVVDASVWIASHFSEFGVDDLKDLELAANLVFAGRIFLPDDKLNQPINIDGSPSDPLMFQAPIVAESLVANSKFFSNAAEILRHIYENIDGTGFPDRKQAWQIPLGSRIIRVVIDFFELIDRYNYKTRAAMDKVQLEANRFYDHRALALLDQYLAEHDSNSSNSDAKAVQLQDLKEGMLLVRDIITTSGLKLLPAGAILRENLINKILYINTSDPILGNIYIKK